MTAYWQQALACAALLRSAPGRPHDLRAVAPDAGRILLRNLYGWFERVQRGVYRLTALGEAALRRWPAIVPPIASEELTRYGESVAVNAASLPDRAAGMTGKVDLTQDRALGVA